MSDFLPNEILGGGELNDKELCSILSKNFDVSLKRCREVKSEDIQDKSVIVSNFITLSEEVKNLLIEKNNYVIYEHDHKYLKNRNPAVYNNYLAPPHELVNIDFYKNARAVFCQSSFHKSIIDRNLNTSNVVNNSGNLWSLDSLNYMLEMYNKKKNDCFSILDSTISHKNTAETVFYCKKKNLNFDLVSSSDYFDFLNKLSNNQKFIFLPKTPETLSRVAVESRMMGMKVFTNKNVGASYEPWFDMKGKELIELIKTKRDSIPKLVLQYMSDI
jgi:hypothetical protein